MAEQQPVKLTDPKAIRALAHPARLAVIEELYAGRKLTATECAEIAGLSPSAMSYHLRSLEKAGIVTRAEDSADGRERPWQAAGAYLQVETSSLNAESTALTSIVMSRLGDAFAAWEARRPSEPQAWQDASMLASGQVWLTVEELEQINALVDDQLSGFRDRADASSRPAGSRRVRFAVVAFPADSPPTGPS